MMNQHLMIANTCGVDDMNAGWRGNLKHLVSVYRYRMYSVPKQAHNLRIAQHKIMACLIAWISVFKICEAMEVSCGGGRLTPSLGGVTTALWGNGAKQIDSWNSHICFFCGLRKGNGCRTKTGLWKSTTLSLTSSTIKGTFSRNGTIGERARINKITSLINDMRTSKAEIG